MRVSQVKLTLAFILLFVLPSVALASGQRATEITISGTITGPNGPVEGVWIGIGTDVEWGETTTDASGQYSLTLDSNGNDYINFHVRAPLEDRLAQKNLAHSGSLSDFTQDFTLEAGYLLELILPVDHFWTTFYPLYDPLPDHTQWYSLDYDETADVHRAVLPPDVYYVRFENLPAGYFPTTPIFDLQNADFSGSVDLNTTFVPPYPTTPPDASKISFGSLDDLKEATVTGAPGAVLPHALVMLANLNSQHYAYAVSDADGSFTARIFAPPGTSIQIKHGPPSDTLNLSFIGNVLESGPYYLPGTIIQRPQTQLERGENVASLPFQTAGGIDTPTDNVTPTVGAAWTISGTLSPVFVDGVWTRV